MASAVAGGVAPAGGGGGRAGRAGRAASRTGSRPAETPTPPPRTASSCEEHMRGGSGKVSLAGVRGGDAAVDVEDVARGLARAALGGEVQDGLGDVLRVDRDLQRVALAVVLVELLRREVVRRGALLTPARAPDL